MNMKKITKKDYWIIGIASFINAGLLLLLLLFGSSFSFDTHYNSFLFAINNFVNVFLLIIISTLIFFFLKWIYKNTVTGFWIVSVLIFATLIAFLSTYSHIFERILS